MNINDTVHECINIMNQFFRDPTKEKFVHVIKNYVKNKHLIPRKFIKIFEVWIASVITTYDTFQVENKLKFKLRKIIDNNTDFYRYYVKYLNGQITLEKLYQVVDLLWISFFANGDDISFNKLLKIIKDDNVDISLRTYNLTRMIVL